MLQSILAQPSVGGGPGFDTTAARVNDFRFAGIERVDLRARYGAPLDGTLHPLSSMGLAAAQALYPNIGLTSSTNLSTFAQDTAAWLQAEYDLRAGAGGIIGAADNGVMVLSSQLWLQNAAKVWFHGGRGTWIRTAGCGATPAIRVSHADQGQLSLPLRDLNLFAKATTVYVSQQQGGVAHTGFASGTAALQIEETQGAIFERVAWNGYDQPISWGDDTFAVTFRDWAASGCNIGLNWSQTAGLNSMERMRFENGNCANNNYGILWNATYGSNNQGGSVFITGNSLDYNVVRSVAFLGMSSSQTSAGSSMHFAGNHMETTGACSGQALSRGLTQGAFFASHNELYEGDGAHPPGYFEIADNAMVTFNGNRMNSNDVPLGFSSTSNLKRVDGCGNRNQDVASPAMLLRDGNGVLMQPDSLGKRIENLFGDPNPVGLDRYGRDFLLSAGGNLTLPSDAQANFPIGYTMTFIKAGGSATQFVVPSGTTLNATGSGQLVAVGATCIATKYASNYWLLRGAGLT